MAKSRRSLFALFSLLVPLTGVAAEPQPSIHLEPKAEPTARFVLKGLPPRIFGKLHDQEAAGASASKFFRVYAMAQGKPAETPMFGDWEINQESIVFVPRYPLRPGMSYRVVFDPRQASDETIRNLTKIERDFQLPNLATGEPTRLTEIFPSGRVLPENLLRFYLCFSAPMSRGEAYHRVRLLDESGKAVESPFLELSEELWSPDGTRFTLYFDPGRIKRGLKPRELFGPSLIEGGNYSLVVDSAWADATGQPLKETFTKEFRVEAPDDVQPNPRRWKIQGPHSETREPLVVAFEKPLDSGMLQRVLEVRDVKGQAVAGTVRLSNNERSWELKPTAAWKPGQYQLVIATALEDLAGNSIRRPFEVDILRPAAPASDADVIELPFEVNAEVKK